MYILATIPAMTVLLSTMWAGGSRRQVRDDVGEASCRCRGRVLAEYAASRAA
jgi:hypothetical protein